MAIVPDMLAIGLYAQRYQWYSPFISIQYIYIMWILIFVKIRFLQENFKYDSYLWDESLVLSDPNWKKNNSFSDASLYRFFSPK